MTAPEIQILNWPLRLQALGTGLVDVLREPTLVAIALQPILVLLSMVVCWGKTLGMQCRPRDSDLLGVVEAGLGDFLLQLTPQRECAQLSAFGTDLLDADTATPFKANTTCRCCRSRPASHSSNASSLGRKH